MRLCGKAGCETFAQLDNQRSKRRMNAGGILSVAVSNKSEEKRMCEVLEG